MKKNHPHYMTIMMCTAFSICSALASREIIEQNGHKFQVHKSNTDYTTLKKDYTGTFKPEGECKELQDHWTNYVRSCAETGNVSYHEFMKEQNILAQYPYLYTRIFSYLKPRIEYMSIGSADNAPQIPLVSQENTITETTEAGEKQKISDRQTAYVLPLSIINLEKNSQKLSGDVINALKVLQENGISVNCVFKEHVTVNLTTGISNHTRELIETDISATEPKILLEKYRDTFMLGENKIAFTVESEHGAHVLGIYAAKNHPMPLGWGAHSDFLMTRHN